MVKVQYFIVAALAGGLVLAWARPQQPGFYHTAERQGRQWLVTPDGVGTVLRGVDHVHLVSASAPQTDLEPAYVDQRAAAIVAGLRANGFNALGGDTDADVWHHGLPYIQDLGISAHLQADQQTALVDVYDPGFASRVQALTQIACPPRAQDRELVGYFSDEGLSWDPTLHPGAVLTYYLQLPLGKPGRQRAMDYLRERYGSSIAKLDRAWGVKAKDFLDLPLPAAGNTAWAADAKPFGAQVLVRYLQVTANAIHAADPNHLYLGANLSFDPDTPLASGSDGALAWSVPDVASVGGQAGQDATALLAALHRITPRPLLLQAAGCDLTATAVARLWTLPALLGYVWSPGGDWQSGPCAAQAQAVWWPLNHQAPTLAAR